jgi:drug/metabolite transporter (DMT)-like permease
VGAATVLFNGPPSGDLVTGFLLIQISNLCFAGGQIAWRRERARLPAETSDVSLFALPYAGAVAACALGSLAFTDWGSVHLSLSQWGVVAYLGVVSSGLCFFWWNQGATRVNVGTLAVFNNAKVPLGVATSLVFFHEKADVPRLCVSLVLMMIAVWIAERRKSPAPSAAKPM